LHSLFCWKPQKHELTPIRTAVSALDRVQRKPRLHHILLALDVLFIDEIGKRFYQQLAILDIMFCKHRDSSLPYSGVLILGSFDPCQIGVIKAMTLLTSTLIFACFQAFKLFNSVRAHHDTQHHEFLNIMQTNAVNLIDDKVKKRRFFDLMDLFRLVTSWEDRSITPSTMRHCAKKVPVTESLENYTETVISRFTQDGTLHHIHLSSDSQRGLSSIGEYLPANAKSKKTLNKNLREPEKHVLYNLGL
jgi:hypothetical protein